MRVCAPADDYPASSRDRSGFNNVIAEVLADELGASVSYEWTPLTEAAMERTLLAGDCDVVIGVGEGVAGMLSTVPYARIPYVFVSRADQGIVVQSLDDPILHSVRIGTYQTGIPSIALQNRGITERVVEYAPVASPTGPDRHTAILDAVVAGEVDVAVVYAVPAAERAEREDVELVLAPVSPEIDIGASILQFSRTMTIGVRPFDSALRDQLNRAISHRWDDVSQAIDAFGVPRIEAVRPASAPVPGPERTAVGVVLPMATGVFNPDQPLGEAARLGVAVAESTIGRDIARRSDTDIFEVLLASAPTDAAAIRAAERLTSISYVRMIAGGFGYEQARALSRIATDRGRIFFNVGSIDDRLRGEFCSVNMFHVEASAAMYLDASVAYQAAEHGGSWFVVHEDSEVGWFRFGRALRSIYSVGGDVAGSAAVPPQSFAYYDVVDDISGAGADTILLLTSPVDQEFFLAQAATVLDAVAVVSLVEPIAQTREFLYRTAQLGPIAGRHPRVTLWEASLDTGPMGFVNDAFASRTGLSMDPVAWAAYAAVLIAFDVAAAGAAAPAEVAIAYLTDPARTFDVGKVPSVSFRDWDHQLRQPLYVVRVGPEATWGRTASARIGLAQLLSTVPEAGALLDDVGDGPADTVCAL
jgi:ABC-type amino acid transport substrate-binding protein/ABC-type branched-subunit amino acid transport system substrate-binding protein